MAASPAQQKLAVPPLVSGGIMLTWRCTNECRHCLYRCSPSMPDEWMTLETAGRVFKALSREVRLEAVHLAGGEPTLRPRLLGEIIRLAVSIGIRISYLETNAQFCANLDRARDLFRHLREAKLTKVLVSVSPFHNEFIPFRNVKNCIQAASEVFGASGVIVYTPQMYAMLTRMDEDRPHALEEFARSAGIAETPEKIPALYGVIPGGRAPEGLRHCYQPKRAGSFEGADCLRDLTSTTHFHVDQNGDLFTGMCAGIAAAGVDDYHPDMSGQGHIVFRKLCEEGPYGLVKVAERGFGFAPRDEGYVSKCDLCFDVRRRLQATGEFPELRPAAYYTTRSRREAPGPPGSGEGARPAPEPLRADPGRESSTRGMRRLFDETPAAGRPASGVRPSVRSLGTEGFSFDAAARPAARPADDARTSGDGAKDGPSGPARNAEDAER